MKNELQIKPLREYEVFRTVYEHGDQIEVKDTFTADTMLRDDADAISFLRTGNVIRTYLHPLPTRIVVTPADAEA